MVVGEKPRDSARGELTRSSTHGLGLGVRIGARARVQLPRVTEPRLVKAGTAVSLRRPVQLAG